MQSETKTVSQERVDEKLAGKHCFLAWKSLLLFTKKKWRVDSPATLDYWYQINNSIFRKFWDNYIGNKLAVLNAEKLPEYKQIHVQKVVFKKQKWLQVVDYTQLL